MQIPAGPPTARHEQTPIEDAHGQVWHNWATDGWDQFDAVTITVSGAQQFVTTAPTGTGLVIGSQAGDGNHRVAYLRRGTEGIDQEVTTLILPPVGFIATNAQCGHLHRVRQYAPGRWEGIAIWTAVVGGGYNLINTRGVRWDGVTLFQSDGDAASSADAGFIDRSVRVWARQRFQFGTWVYQLDVTPTHAWGLAINDRINVTSVSGAPDETNIPVGNVDTIGGSVQATPATTGALAWSPTPAGTVTPASDQKRYAPFWLRSRVTGRSETSQVVEWMRWRLGEAMPDWSDPRVQRRTITANANVPALAVSEGRAALWAAHMTAGSGVRFGDLKTSLVAS